MNESPLIIHAINHLVMGGLENGLINLINRMPTERYRHVVVCIEYFSDFRKRLQRDDVPVIAMNKRPGRDPATAWRLWKLFRRLKPSIVHSRNLSGLNALVPAVLAGSPCRLHSEHGWQDADPNGSNVKFRVVRRVYRPFVNHYVALSHDLECYLTKHIGVPETKVTRIINGVDTESFRPNPFRDSKEALIDSGFSLDEQSVVVGTVSRFELIKSPMTLAEAFVKLVMENEFCARNLRLIMVGDGPEWSTVKRYLEVNRVTQKVWLPGARDDIASLLPSFDIFALPSKGEGISNTILEAMACGLPIVATQVGGNDELVVDRGNGILVSPGCAKSFAIALERYAMDPTLRRQHGRASRHRAESQFNLDIMVRNYLKLYDTLIGKYCLT